MAHYSIFRISVFGAVRSLYLCTLTAQLGLATSRLGCTLKRKWLLKEGLSHTEPVALKNVSISLQLFDLAM